MKKEFGVLAACIVEEAGNNYVIVLFDSWNAEWNRRVCDPREVRNRTVPDRKRKQRNLSSTKILFSDLCLRFKKANIAKTYVNRKLRFPSIFKRVCKFA